VLVIACFASACATTTGSSRVRDGVRDIEGNQLPPYALGTTTEPVVEVHCPDGRSYLVVTDPPSYLYGARFGTVIRFMRPGIGDVCDRILASRP
jgi:hypothetical protein